MKFLDPFNNPVYLAPVLSLFSLYILCSIMKNKNRGKE